MNPIPVHKINGNGTGDMVVVNDWAPELVRNGKWKINRYIQNNREDGEAGQIMK